MKHYTRCGTTRREKENKMGYPIMTNVPALRKVAFAAYSRLVREIGLQVIPFSAPISDFPGYTQSVNVPADRKAAKRPALATWRYNVWLSVSLGIGPQVTPLLNDPFLV